MGASKTDLFTDSQNAIAKLAKALGHPARIAIIEYLSRVDACICGDIVDELPLAQPTISQHLRELKSAGIITGTTEGNAICYCIDRTTLNQLQAYLATLAERLDQPNNNCC